MEVCYEVCSEGNCISAMNIVIVPTLILQPSVRSLPVLTVKSNGKPVLVCEHCKKPWPMKNDCWKLHGQPLNGEKFSPGDKHNFDRSFMSESFGTSQCSTPAGN